MISWVAPLPIPARSRCVFCSSFGPRSSQLRPKPTLTRALVSSYQWDAQPIVRRLNDSLKAHGYLVWLDSKCSAAPFLRLGLGPLRQPQKEAACCTVEQMKGSIMDAMSDAIEGAEVMLYGVSLPYKESANCRLEANYAMQQELDMIPLMMQDGFRAKGWLGLILGTAHS